MLIYVHLIQVLKAIVSKGCIISCLFARSSVHVRLSVQEQETHSIIVLSRFLAA